MKIHLIIATILLSLGAGVNGEAIEQQVRMTKAPSNNNVNVNKLLSLMEEQGRPGRPKATMMEEQVRTTQAPSNNNAGALQSLKGRLKKNTVMEEQGRPPNNNNNKNSGASQKNIFTKNTWSQIGNMEALVGNRAEKKEKQKSIQEILAEIQETLHGNKDE